MEIGSFIELQFSKEKEFYSQQINVARLNTGRAAIWHAFLLTGAKSIWIPYYQCDSVRAFLKKKGTVIKFYHIDRHFNPIDISASQDEAVLLVNYFGIMSQERMRILSMSYPHAIIDNCQAFFCRPLPNAFNVYSTRKFVGVADGSYVIGANAERYVSDYSQSYSSDTAAFLLQRVEYGCEGKGYESRKINEHRIDSEGIMRMSKLTRVILDGTDYDYIKLKRKQNFQIADDLLGNINQIDSTYFYDQETVPMVYPLVIEDDSLLGLLLNHKHFQGHWWSYLLKEMPKDSFEYWMSRYVIPITIDQRYGREDIEYIAKIIKEHIHVN